jgi:hypothetical protein
MATPADHYEAAPTPIVETLKGLDQTKNYFVGATPAVRLMEAASEGRPLYLFVRIETPDCDEWCPNAIFKAEVSSESFVAFAFLPLKSAWGDTWRRPCGNCAKTQSLIFYGDDNGAKVISVGLEGLFF